MLENVSGSIKDIDDLRAQLSVMCPRPARLLGDLGWEESEQY